MKFFLSVIFLVIACSSANSQKVGDERAAQRLVEMMDKVMSGKDGAYEVMEDFSECSGFYDALANHFEVLDKKVATNLRNYGNGAELVARFFWAGHSKDPKIVVKSVIDANVDQYASIISLVGLNDKQVTDKMYYCSSLTPLQAEIIKSLRKTY